MRPLDLPASPVPASHHPLPRASPSSTTCWQPPGKAVTVCTTYPFSSCSSAHRADPSCAPSKYLFGWYEVASLLCSLPWHLPTPADVPRNSDAQILYLRCKSNSSLPRIKPDFNFEFHSILPWFKAGLYVIARFIHRASTGTELKSELNAPFA